MRTPALVLALGLSFAFAALVSCGTAQRCSATTCPTGCCDSSGLCQSGSSTSACGSKGTACAACGVTASCVAGACMQNIGAGAGSAGGGTSGTGGGSSGTGGGSSGTGGGSSGTGGGSSGTGGGSSGTGGGSSGTGGGAGGGSGTSTVFCNRLLAAQTRFFAGRSSCPGAITLSPSFNATACAATWSACTESDRGYLDQIVTCLESAPVCTTGNESAATSGFLQCLSLTEALSQACATSLTGAP
ncbi:MAG: hypothetical protein JNM69_23985 [Archangium sp.]|nr:hypothetical protein [Archangium sp.]